MSWFFLFYILVDVSYINQYQSIRFHLTIGQMGARKNKTWSTGGQETFHEAHPLILCPLRNDPASDQFHRSPIFSSDCCSNFSNYNHLIGRHGAREWAFGKGDNFIDLQCSSWGQCSPHGTWPLVSVGIILLCWVAYSSWMSICIIYPSLDIMQCF